jgi:diguanylate cyclase (GGDEF)-like protein
MHLTTQPESNGSALQRVKAELCERLWLSVCILVLVLAPISIARAWDTGWLPIYTGHMAALAVLAITFVLRHRLPAALRVALAITCLELGGVGGLFRMGFLGFSALWLAAGAYVIGVLYGWRAGVLAVAAHILVVAIMMGLYVSGKQTVPIDANDYMRQPWPWLLFATMMAIFPWMLLNSIGLYKQSILDLLLESEQQRAEIERLATHDPLTGLVQLRVLNERLESTINRARSNGRNVAVLFIDLDGFKQVNDRFGHAAGDHLLRSVARSLGGLVRDADTVGRLGGDEFLVVLDDVSGVEVAAVAARRILQELRRPVAYRDALLQVGASIGIAMSPEHGTTAESLRQAADVAMYSVKNSGRNDFAFSGARPGRIQPEPSAVDTLRNIRVPRRHTVGF